MNKIEYKYPVGSKGYVISLTIDQNQKHTYFSKKAEISRISITVDDESTITYNTKDRETFLENEIYATKEEADKAAIEIARIREDKIKKKIKRTIIGGRIVDDTMDPTYNHADCKMYDSRSKYEKAVKAAGYEIAPPEYVDAPSTREWKDKEEMNPHVTSKVYEALKSTWSSDCNSRGEGVSFEAKERAIKGALERLEKGK